MFFYFEIFPLLRKFWCIMRHKAKFYGNPLNKDFFLIFEEKDLHDLPRHNLFLKNTARKCKMGGILIWLPPDDNSQHANASVSHFHIFSVFAGQNWVPAF